MTLTPPEVREGLLAHWAPRADLELIRRDLKRRGKDLGQLTLTDLASHDQLHAGQLKATRDFVAWLDVHEGARVLDLGAGLGGSARLLAAERGCRVLAVELSPPLHQTGTVLTEWLGLDHLVEHRCADLLAAPDWTTTADGFDLVWLQHVDMHVPDKVALYSRMASQLSPDGRGVWHDWLAGPGGPPHFPVPWSDAGELSFLAPPDEYEKGLREAGLTLARLEDITERTHGWFAHTHAGLLRAIDALPPESTRRRTRFTTLDTRIKNVLRNLDSKRLLPFYGETTRARSV